MNQFLPPKSAADILIVDDRPNNLKLLSKILTTYEYNVHCAMSGAMALEWVKKQLPDLILLDVSMPDMDGYQVCSQMQQDPEMGRIPIIFISALGTVFDKVKAFQVGGRDYITKPFEIAEVIARIQNQLQLKQVQEQLCTLNQQLEFLNENLEQKVTQKTTQLEAEVIQRRQAQDKLLHMAMHDPLTNLANRNYLQTKLQTCVDLVRQFPERKFALLFLGCDRFKLVNDSLGHLAGDELLVAIAHRLQSLLPKNGFLARSGGDEFTVILEEINSVTEAIEIVKGLQQEFTKPTIFGQRKVFMNFSVGIVLGTKNYETPEQLLRNADLAMHQAKRSGVTTYKVFNNKMHKEAISSLQLETDLQIAVSKEEFVLHYQPIVCLKKNRIVGVEALIRWVHPNEGMLSPYKFIPIAEETNLIIPLGMWVFREACSQLAKWQKQVENPILASLDIEINISVQQLTQPNLIEEIEKIVRDTGIERRGLKLEITESIFMERVETSKSTLNKLKAHGLELILDDFGTGYSSLEYLQKLPISTLKIDRSFVGDLEHIPHNKTIVKATIDLAHTLGLNVVAEGIETLAQLAILKDLGCDYGQGYLFSKPVAVDHLEVIIQNFERDFDSKNSPIN